MKRTITIEEVKKYINQKPEYPLSNHETEKSFRPKDKFQLMYKIKQTLQTILKESETELNSALDEFDLKLEPIEKRYPDYQKPDDFNNLDYQLAELNAFNQKQLNLLKEDENYIRIKKELSMKREPYYPILMMTSEKCEINVYSLIEQITELMCEEHTKEIPFNAREPFSDEYIKVINEVIHFSNFNSKYRKNVANLNQPTFDNYVEFNFYKLDKYLDYFSALNMNYRIIKNEEVKELYDVSIFTEEEISKFPYQ